VLADHDVVVAGAALPRADGRLLARLEMGAVDAVGRKVVVASTTTVRSLEAITAPFQVAWMGPALRARRRRRVAGSLC